MWVLRLPYLPRFDQSSPGPSNVKNVHKTCTPLTQDCQLLMLTLKRKVHLKTILGGQSTQILTLLSQPVPPSTNTKPLISENFLSSTSYWFPSVILLLDLQFFLPKIKISSLSPESHIIMVVWLSGVSFVVML